MTVVRICKASLKFKFVHRDAPDGLDTDLCTSKCKTKMVWMEYHKSFEKTKEAFVPPNPKLFDIDTFTVLCCATLGI